MTDGSSTQHSTLQQKNAHHLAIAAGLGLLVFVTALLGIWARPIGFLSAIWPANPILLGVLLHRPHWLRPSSALAIFAGYFAADMVTGSRPDVASLLSLANMAGVGAAWLLMRRYKQETICMQRQSSALLLFVGAGLASIVAAAMGTPVLAAAFHTPPGKAFSMWLSSEWMNYMILLPSILAWPTRSLPRPASEKLFPLLQAMPVLMVVVLELISYWMGGPGALVFSLPALLWCALSYRIFTLTIITAALCLSKLAAVALGSFDFTPEHFLETVSFRIGLCMLVLGPLAVASTYMARNDLMHKLRHAVNHDFLTDVLARGAFLKQGQYLLQRCSQTQSSAAVLMLDLDHFKRINDNHGHAGGDELLRRFSLMLTSVLREQDLIGRLGGEEFAAVIPRVDHATALEIAKRINQATRDLWVSHQNERIHATVSIGLMHVQTLSAHQSLDELLQQADHALYEAKAQGRDRCELRQA